ncbi:hypothetical protein CLV63_14810 [Murinocardiopsis flavida]|uniref:Tetracyclin repressor-like C-terminal domain-containing protein n=1 Tax=Murinocardiopsis flavida TaxID=645275 RepID=A0A2P8C8C0_9ACTN|nr:hypothetical protein CLV63_14810 [Murinocardiopsis flavida]
MTSQALGAAARRWVEQSLELVSTGQRRGEVREGLLDGVALTVFAPLHGYVGLAVSGVPLPATDERGLDDVIASIIRACRPD